MAFQDSADSLRSRLHLTALRPAALGVLLTAAAVLVGAIVVFAGALAPPAFEVRPASEAPAAGTPEGGAGSSAPTPEEPARIYVHVGGAVAAPGVYAVPEGSRVDDAVAAAGGLAADAAPDGVNRARVVVDGEQVVIPTLQDQEAAAPSASVPAAGASAPSSKARVNLNAATAAELVTLNGIGEATAAKIVADREANGPFATVDDLMRVPGIGEKKLAALRDAVCV